MTSTSGPWRIDDFPLDIEAACACIAADEGTDAEWIGICTPYDEEGNYEHVAYCHPDNAGIIALSVEAIPTLVKAEAFIAGFEGDELQEGVDKLLDEIRSVIRRSSGESDEPVSQPEECSNHTLVDALLIALPYVEDALDDPCFKKGAVEQNIKTIRAAIETAEKR